MGWDTGRAGGFLYTIISIHPPLVGWDSHTISTHFSMVISIHPPLVGWDTPSSEICSHFFAFQSTHPLWGGTCPPIAAAMVRAFQSTHPLWGGTFSPDCKHFSKAFQSTHPLWGGTGDFWGLDGLYRISIHPPLVGWDKSRVFRLK